MATGKQSGSTCAILGDDTLTPGDAVYVLEEILEAQNKYFELGLKLKLQYHEVDAIHSSHAQHSATRRLYEVLVAFTKQVEPRPTWRVIVDALRNPVVNLPHLAESVEAAHFPKPTRAPEAGTTGMAHTE